MTKVVVKKKKKSSKPKSHSGSIVEKTEMVPLEKLNLFHENPNIGDPEKTAESLRVNGQFRSIVVNVGTYTNYPNEILAGNHTYKGAQRNKMPKIQVDWVDVTEEHARRIVLADNGTRDGSKYDESVLTKLLNEQKDETGSLLGTSMTDDVLAKLTAKPENSDEPNAGIDKVEDADENLVGVRELKAKGFFESDLPYDIPPLREDYIPDSPPMPLDTWAGHELDGKDKIGEEKWEETWWLSMWHAGSMGINWPKAIPFFYTDDFHFDSVYTDPAKNTKKILNLGIEYVIMPNYSINEDMPVAMWVWATYRSFYVGRYMQEAGLQVIPDIQIGRHDSVLDISLLGIPEDCGTVAAQVQNTRGDLKALRYTARMLKEAEDRIGFKNIILYGHTDADEVEKMARFDCNVVRVPARTAKRRVYLNSSDASINSHKNRKKKK